jgi:hypothetical protein
MADAYEAWQETKRRLADEPDSTYLQRVEESLRPSALEAYLERFIGEHAAWDDQEEASYGLVTSGSVQAFLEGLDELRQPTVRPDEVRAEVARQVDDVLGRMKRLNWTGAHDLYGDALDDARVIVRHVLSGKTGWPVLERFRCPSLFGKKGNPVRCELQLPHGDSHRYQEAGWTDEESTNPPVPYDSDAEELSGHPVRKADRLKCAASLTTNEATLRCDEPAGHTGDHIDESVKARWSR